MATSGRIETGRNNNTCFFLAWQLAHQDVGGNWSRVNWQAGVNMSRNAYWYSNAVRINHAHINGSRVAGGTWSNISGTGDRVLQSGHIDIGHNEAGQRWFEANIEGWLYGGGNFSTSGGWSLPDIPRASAPAFSKSSYVIGENIVVHMNRKASWFTHRGSIQFPDGNSIKDFSGAGASFSFTPNGSEIDALYGRIPNAQSATLGFDLVTMNGSQQIGGNLFQNVSMRVDPAVCSPLFSNFSLADSNALSKAITENDQILIRGVSTLTATIGSAQKAVARKHATMRRYGISGNGKSVEVAYSSGNIVENLGTVTTEGSCSVEVTAIDSRGLSKSARRSLTVVPYTSPAATVSAVRKNNFENETTITIGGVIAPIMIGNHRKNWVTVCRIRRREAGGSWGAWENKLSNISIQNNKNVVVPSWKVSLDNNKQFEFELEIKDRIKTTVTRFSLDIGIAIMRIGVDGKIYNKEQVLMASHVGQILQTVSLNTPEKVSAIYGGTWVLFGAGRVIVGVGSNGTTNYTAAEQTGGSDKVQLTTQEMPSHTHEFAHRMMVWDARQHSAVPWQGGNHPGQFFDWNSTASMKPRGGDKAHENRQAFVTAYQWKRVL